MDEVSTTEDLAGVDSVSDHDLLVMARGGFRPAAVELWQRHSEYGVAVASGLAPDEDWETTSDDTWATILHPATIEEAPDGFRPYLYRVIRAASSFEEDTRDSFLTSAFQNLPDRWREVLWYAHVESMKPTQISPFIGVSAAEVPRLLNQAREGLRQEWAHLHAEATPPGSQCRQVWESSGSYVRTLLTDQNTVWIQQHMRGCRTCKSAHSDTLTVASHLRKLLLPTVTGSAGAVILEAYINAYGPCVRATTDLPDVVEDLFQADSPLVPADADEPLWRGETPEPRKHSSAGRLKPLPLLLGAIFIVALVIVVIVATRSIREPNPSSPASHASVSSVDTTHILTVDTGSLNNVFPIASGSAAPGARVSVQIGATDLTLTADDQGAWTTADSFVEFSSIRGVISASTDQDQEPAVAIFEIAPPPIVEVSSGTSFALLGLPESSVEILIDGASSIMAALDTAGSGLETLPLERGTHFIQVRYTDQSRIGPSSTALTLTVP